MLQCTCVTYDGSNTDDITILLVRLCAVAGSQYEMLRGFPTRDDAT